MICLCIYIYINVGEKILENHDYTTSDAKVKSE